MKCPTFEFQIPKNEVWDIEGELYCYVPEGHEDYPVTVELTCKEWIKLNAKYRGQKLSMIQIPCELDPCSFEGQLVAAVQANGGTTEGMGLSASQVAQVEQIVACGVTDGVVDGIAAAKADTAPTTQELIAQGVTTGVVDGVNSKP
jgi:hypothetical protein